MTVPASIFRAYDIRGVVDDTLTEATTALIGQAVGSEALARGERAVIVAYDGRLSGPGLREALVAGLLRAGVDVIDIGRVPTPVLYFATHTLAASRSGVMITGSHNPPEYNGFKIVLGGETLSNDTVTALYQRIDRGELARGEGHYRKVDVREAYLERITHDIRVARPLHAVVDCGNGVAGELGPELIRRLGVRTTPLFDEIDGRFPNHHPDPGKPENLTALIDEVRRQNADIGLAFDGDGDRLGVVTQSGQIIKPDHLLALFATDLLSRQPGAGVIFDVKCSRSLADTITGAGGAPEMWRTGHSLIKARMIETGALLGGEMSGHIFFKERWYGFDDGLYAAARLLEILGGQRESAEALFARFPQEISTPEINIAVADEEKFELVRALASDGDFGEGIKTMIDGIRVDYVDGFGLCRASNTTPALVLRFEGASEAALSTIRARFARALARTAPELDITAIATPTYKSAPNAP
ncbi:phosphomannomutase/phosphoglucomutase [Halomonas sp. HNIBRBA4712]|uniref:phosphomannomutase/phosphoglucomutase n=1 Tax=Halomonas sp. HNIBRBA4712 TaxID=3373087 RepID=UPI003745B154